MTRAASVRAGRRGSGGKSTRQATIRTLHDYFARSSLPLTVLLFLLPMVILYEVGTIYFAYDWQRHIETRVLAFNLMRQFLQLCGATGRYLPGMAVVGILLAWHIARKDPWKLQFGTAAGMVVESALLGLPLLALSNILGYCLPLYAPVDRLEGGIVLALGAGVYEELVFRLMAFTFLNMLLVDLLRIERRQAYLLIVVATSLLFASYHYWSLNSAGFRWSDFIFRTLSGVYFAGLFMTRGFGITAGSHAAYDVYFFALRTMAA